MSGVRSSCEASATKRRSCSSDASLSRNADSILDNMTLSDDPRRPTSVRSSVSSTRRDRSPAAISPAVPAIVSSGLSPSWTRKNTIAPTATRIEPVTMISRMSTLPRVELTGLIGSPTANMTGTSRGNGPPLTDRLAIWAVTRNDFTDPDDGKVVKRGESAVRACEANDTGRRGIGALLDDEPQLMVSSDRPCKVYTVRKELSGRPSQAALSWPGGSPSNLDVAV